MSASVDVEDGLLYHYTTFEAFTSIIASRTLWASHIRYLNDSSEQRIMWDLLRRYVERQLEQATGVEREGLCTAQRLISSPIEADVYILSFCSDGGNRLSQWRAYTAGCGVAIGFDKSRLIERCSIVSQQWQATPNVSGSAILYKVRYMDPEVPDDHFSANMIEALGGLAAMDSGIDHDTRLQQAFSILAAGLKHAAFDEEAEWRIQVSNLSPLHPIKFRMRKTLPVPYVEIPLGDNFPALISRVVVGPHPHKEEAVRAVKTMLPGGVEVTPSNTPYRDW